MILNRSSLDLSLLNSRRSSHSAWFCPLCRSIKLKWKKDYFCSVAELNNIFLRNCETRGGYADVCFCSKLRWYDRWLCLVRGAVPKKKISKIIERQRAKYSSLQLTSASQLVFQATFLIFTIFKEKSRLFGSQWCSDSKNWLEFLSILFVIFGFPSSILLKFAVSSLFYGKRCLIQIWQWRDFLEPNPLLRISTNDIASFWIGNRLR